MKTYLKLFLACSSGAFLTLGCSKEQAVAPDPLPMDEAVAPTETDQTAAQQQYAVPPDLGAQFQQDMSAASQSIDAGDYDRAITTLVTMDQVPKSAQAQAAWETYYYQQRQALLQKAEYDEQARQAYERLGRQVLGR